MNIQASKKENSEKKIKNEIEISKLTNAPPNDTAALHGLSVRHRKYEKLSGKIWKILFVTFS